MTRRDALTPDLFAGQSPVEAEAWRLEWPDQDRFPLNVDRRRSGEVVLGDLRRSERPLLVTGYASLDRLIDFIARLPEECRARLLLGAEPFPSRRERHELRGYSFHREVEEYWLRRGISPLLSAALLLCLERLRSGQVEARCLPDPGHRLHAKIYLGDAAVTLGSSNFTEAGLERQLEANVRFTRKGEPKRYREAARIAGNYWSLGRDYGEELAALLEKLLLTVPWQEALARACSELLEGEWAGEVLPEAGLPGEAELWPSQRQGIAQALYILARQGSVLVADATGSGKTRMGVHLVRALSGRIARSGRTRAGRAVMVCPPAVAENWEEEAILAGTALEVHSHGSLSHARSGRHGRTVESLRRAQILCVDEGHNFLNLKSNRSQHLLRNLADHVLLFTATPINRSVTDLLRIADMLGADNLEPSTLRAFHRMLGVRNPGRNLTEEEIVALRAEIQKFTVRRTKRELNVLIAREPEAYRDARGRPCRFPRHDPRIYSLEEPESDRALAGEIRELAGRLRAVSHFLRRLEMPAVLRQQGWSEQSYLESRLHSAQKIARYLVMALLRSSRAALAEHISGTAWALERFELGEFRKAGQTGDMLGRLEEIAGRPPESRLAAELPDWLREPEAHARACAADREIYRQILERVLRMSEARERRKAALLEELAGRHELVLAFDRSPLTLALIRRHLRQLDPARRVEIATGDPGSGRSAVLESLRGGSRAREIVALCSDSLSEGVNLQQASCLVHLDMPSVVRIAEQRAGRVDRLDSPHQAIEVWWPQDAPEFALAADEHFVERYETVESLLGSNMPLPGEMSSRKSRPLRAEEVIEEYEQTARESEWDGIHDAFEPVRKLIDGPRNLIARELYERIRDAASAHVCRLSVVAAARPWAFFCLAGGARRAPYWVLFPEPEARPLSDLDQVAAALRRLLGESPRPLPHERLQGPPLERFIARLGEVERELLPRKKQRALEEMGRVLERYGELAAERQDQPAVDHCRALLEALRDPRQDPQPDWDAIASGWLELIRPVWYDCLRRPRRKPLQLRDIRAELIAREAAISLLLRRRFPALPLLAPAGERIVACVVGLPEGP